MNHRRSIFAAVLPIVFCLALPAFGQTRTDATRLKEQGDELLLANEYEEALRAYEASQALRPHPSIHYNRGRALEALGRLKEAVEAFERFLFEAPASLRQKAPALREHIDSLRNRLAPLVPVRVAVPLPVPVAVAPEVEPSAPRETTEPNSHAGVLSQWWFWAAASAVVASAVIATAVLVDRDEPRSGDLGPGRVTAPLLRF